MKAEIYPIPIATGRLAIMPRPRAGDWLEGEIESWRGSGMNVVVSLLEDAEVEELGLERESEFCSIAGVKFLRFPITDRSVPKSDDDLAALVTALVRELQNGLGVGIHCRIGVGRSALVAACILAVLGSAPEAAWGAIEKARGQSVPDTEEQRDWLQCFLLQFASVGRGN